jgi:hypothetical protein
MSVIQRSKDAEQLWQAMLPHVPQPEIRQFVVWANRFSDEQMERAIMRTHRKFAVGAQPVAPAVIHKYVTGILLNLEREQQTKGESSMTTTNNALSNEQLKFIEPVLEHYQTTNPQDEAARNKLRTFLHAAAEVHPAPPVNEFLEYFTDTTDGEAFLKKYGANATGEDMREFVQSRLATQQ